MLKPAFLARARGAVEALARDTADGGPGLIVGAPWLEQDEAAGPLRHHVTNSVFLLDGGEIVGRRDKRELPNYGVFDEVRVFKPGPPPGPLNFRGVRLGVPVCEDLWTPEVPECLVESGAEILIVPNGSPYERDKAEQRIQHAVRRVTETGLPIVYVNQVGGQDELVFDGGSFVLDARCHLRAQLPMFREALVMTEWRRADGGAKGGDGAAGGTEAWTCADAHLEPPGIRHGAGLWCADAGPAGLRQQEPLHRRYSGAFRRHRFGADCGGRDRRPRSEPRSLRDDALALHQPGQPG